MRDRSPPMPDADTEASITSTIAGAVSGVYELEVVPIPACPGKDITLTTTITFSFRRLLPTSFLSKKSQACERTTKIAKVITYN